MTTDTQPEPEHLETCPACGRKEGRCTYSEVTGGPRFTGLTFEVYRGGYLGFWKCSACEHGWVIQFEIPWDRMVHTP